MADPLSVPTRPCLLTSAFLQQILRPVFPLHRVVNFEWQPMNLGVLAEVVIIAVEFAFDDGCNDAQRTHRRFVGKFRRPECSFESMFTVESRFYRKFAVKAGDAAMQTSTAAVGGFPFAIPAAIFTSNVLIVLECVESVKTFTCLEGSPPHYIPMLVTKLAQMHARYWGSNCDGLATPAGIGSQLTGEDKRLQFPGCWNAYVDDVFLQESSEKAQLTHLCTHLSNKPDQLHVVHELVNSGPSSLIHGDFHIANVLLPTDDDSKDVTWLLDWATCGKGNPLRDLAFFFIVSVRASHRREQEGQCLKAYHEALRTEAGVAWLSFEELLWQYKMCVLNQFVILVVYDSLSKSFAANATTDKLRTELEAHFKEVNRRACLSVVDNCTEEELAGLETY